MMKIDKNRDRNSQKCEIIQSEDHGIKSIPRISKNSVKVEKDALQTLLNSFDDIEN